MGDLRQELVERYGLHAINLTGRCLTSGWKMRGVGYLAHTHTGGQIICYTEAAARDPKHWNEGFPTPTILHEIAHVQTPDCNHDRTWRMAYFKLLMEWGYDPDLSRLKSTYDQEIERMVVSKLRKAPAPVARKPEPVDPRQGRLF